MTFRKKTLRDLEAAEGQTVLVRADLNVPLEGGEVADDTRIRAALPVIEDLRSRGAKVVVASHLGRPKGHDPAYSLEPVSKRLGELLGATVRQAPAGRRARLGTTRDSPPGSPSSATSTWTTRSAQRTAPMLRPSE